MKTPVVTKDNLVIGARVKRGPDWEYDQQDVGSAYGVIICRHPDPVSAENWVRVVWYDESGSSIAEENSYRIYCNDLVYVPKFNVGDRVKICGSFKCNGYGWKNKSRTYYAVDGVGNTSFIVKDYHWDKKKKEFYYDFNGGYVAEHALSSPNLKSSNHFPKYKFGDILIVTDHHPKMYVDHREMDDEKEYRKTSLDIGKSLGSIVDIHYSSLESMYYYRFGQTGRDCYREDCLGLKQKANPSPKYRIGDRLIMNYPSYFECGRALSNVNKKDYQGSSSTIRKGTELGEVIEIHYCEVNSSYYYLCKRYYPNCYKEDCIELESTIINNQNQNQNGKSNNNTEVPRLIKSESNGEGSTGVTIQSRRRKASVISGSVSYQKIIGKR